MSNGTIDDLKSDAQRRKELERCCAEFRKIVRSTEPIDRKECTDAIIRFYSHYGRPVPKIIWCESPWQMVALHLLCQLFPLKKSLWDHRHEIEQGIRMPLWQTAFGQANAQLSAKDIMSFRPRSAVINEAVDFIQPETFEAHSIYVSSLMGFNCWIPFIGNLSDGQFSWVTHLLDDLDRQFSHSQFAEAFEQLVRIADEQRACVQQAASFNNFDLDALQSALAMCGAGASKESDNDQAATREKGNLSGLPSKIWVEPNSSPNKHRVYAEFVLSKVWWASWQIGTLPLYDALSGCFARSPMIERQRKLLRITSDLARLASAYSFLEHVCFVCERPTQDARDEHARFTAKPHPLLRIKTVASCIHGMV